MTANLAKNYEDDGGVFVTTEYFASNHPYNSNGLYWNEWSITHD